MLQLGFGFHGVLERFFTEIAFGLPNVVFCMGFLTWVLVDMVMYRRRRENGREIGIVLEHYHHGRNPNFYTRIITPLCNASMLTLYLCFCLYKFSWCHENLSYVSISCALAWVLSNFVLVYSRNRTLVHEKRWPLVLIIWWVYSLVFYLILILFYIITHFTSINLHIPYLPKAEFVDFLACPLSILLCFNALPYSWGNQRVHRHELEQSLLSPRQEVHKEGCSFTNSNIWSKLTFSWLNPLFRIGRTQLLELADISSIPESETAEKASCLLEESLQTQKKKMDAFSLPKAIMCTVWKSLIANAFFAWANTIASYMGPLLITWFVDYISRKGEDPSYDHGVGLALIFLLAKSIESLSQRQLYFGASRIGIRVRAAIIALVYGRSLKIKSFAAGQANGQIINIINVDAERLGDLFMYIHGIWLLPLQIILALVILYVNLGAAPAFAALSSTIMVMVCNTPLANRQEMLHSKIMEAKDLRIKATMETLKSMRVLKLHSWETTFLGKLLKLRDTEKSWLSKYLYNCSTIAFLFWASPTLVSVVTFGVCILAKTSLTSGTVLSALATFKILQEPIYNLPELLSMIVQARVSVARIENFLRDEDQMRPEAHRKSDSSDYAIDIEPGEYAWDSSDQNRRKATIRISDRLRIKKGSKVAVCGSVGSGKSSLLYCILGEIPRISGRDIKVYGTKAYVPQTAWIQTGTVRDNILFGKDMNKAFYEEVLEACALKKDLEMWADADMCLVGERGMNLSGGQKQRIQLARALYSDADVYFLDDPFSAVDAHTGAHLFKRCLMERLSNKTVLYITHQLEFLDAADLVLVMKDGTIVQSGKYEDLIREPNGELLRQMNAYRNSLEQVHTGNGVNESTVKSTTGTHVEVIEEKSPFLIQYDKLEKTNEEEVVRGRVSWHVYSTFITAAYGGALVPVILLCQILFQALQMGSTYWLAWATEEERQVSKKQLLGYFVLLSGSSCIFILGRTTFLSTIAIETAHRLFVSMIKSVFRAPISFFDFTPSSRILSRSSTDQSTVDMDIPYRLAGLVFALIQLLSIVVLMCHVAWQVFLVFAVVLAVSTWYQAYYITTARELARMVGIRKSPILHHFSESMSGTSTIRCFKQEERFYMGVLSLANDYSRVTFHNTAAMEWLSVRINFLFNLAFFIVLVILVRLPRSAINPSMSGLVATYGLNMNVLQAWVIWNLCNVENKMISVERILDFSWLPSEAPPVIEDCRPEPGWPTEGFIQFENLHIQYSPALPMVVKGITCTVPAKKKVGVVGRTGSGKSTLIQALFRVVEPSLGCILIDGIDICKIGLEDLRSKLSIIPQDPTLFQGTVRVNLDPLGEHSDQEIWEVLNKCDGLATVVRQDQRLLDAPVTEDGENWSVGQRQLVCLARVLLQRRKILVLDEATASVDTATDNLIQKTIRDETSECTVITIAHRIPTVMDNDLVLVLDQGKIIEYDTPAALLADSGTAFSKLVKEYMNRSSKHQ